MCGINGIIRFDASINKKELKLMNEAIKHRGPDDNGLFVYNNKKYSVGFGHVRLSILDLSKKGHEPMGHLVKKNKIIYDDKKLKNADLIIVFNGEIYNYLELKDKYRLRTETGTDTEVILKLYNKFGPDCVKEFNGMWAFCIFDKRKNLAFCSRDRLGQKPFYYYFNSKSKEFVFSSELKGIISIKKVNKKQNINRDAVRLYFALGFIPSPYSIYTNVFKLEARQNLILNLNNGRIKKTYYWKLPKYKPIYDKNKLIKEGKRLLYDAVKLRMRSDVPVGAFLSGGLDSSTVVGVMSKYTNLKKLHTFSIGFEGKYDETHYIKIVKDYFKTNHHHYYFKEKDFEGLIDKYAWIYDEPFGDYSGFPTYKVSEIAKKFVTVSLSGDGGDEIFGGYLSHLTGYRLDFIRKFPRILRMLGSKIPVKKNLNNAANLYLLKEAFKLSLLNPERLYAESVKNDAIRPEIYKKWTIEKLKYTLSKGGGKLGEAMRIFDLLFNTLSDNFLVKVDRASMANALEVRSPFLDYRFAEFSQRIPTNWKQDLFKTKKLMREIIKDILPEEIVNRGKQGFTPPLADWILKDKYLKKITMKLEVLKELDLDLYKFFKSRVFKNKEQSLYRNYLIRLFLLIKWWEKWIE